MELGSGELLAIGGALGAASAAVINAISNAVIAGRKQPFDQAMIMVGKLEERIDALARAHKECQDQHASQQLEIGTLREEVRYLRAELNCYEQEKPAPQTPPDPAAR
jgi:hypothetical protein